MEGILQNFYEAIPETEPVLGRGALAWAPRKGSGFSATRPKSVQNMVFRHPTIFFSTFATLRTSLATSD